ncbi:MAG TPA: extracellular solute-binding protein, partial [Polyangiaceae bacterium]|nr:extracellular solute-binding protein [Polyangiaceae bacterium]
MIERFPYGRAPFWLLVLAVGSTCALLFIGRRGRERRADLTFALFAPNHLPAYNRVTPAFERKHGVRIAFQRVEPRALQTRLQNAMLSGTEVPDLVELPEGALTFFTRGPLKDVGFLDLTQRLEREGYRQRLVESRLSLWSSRRHVFALPHDVHPVMLAYRADLVESLGIDVSKLTTWDEFAAVGRRVVKDLDGDGVPDRYMLDLPLAATWGVTVLLRQRGVGLFDEQGRVAFNDPKTVETMIWYLHQTVGKERIAFECGEGQPLVKAMLDGLVLFYLAPDWRTFVIEQQAPRLAGKMKLMPLPAWEPGGRRTSVWGGTGLAIAARSPHVELAWEFAKFLYFDKSELGQRFLGTNIIPPLRDAWDLPEFKRRKAFYGGQALGEVFASLAPETPPSWNTAYSKTAEAKLNAVFLRAVDHYRAHGDAGLQYVLTSLFFASVGTGVQLLFCSPR